VNATPDAFVETCHAHRFRLRWAHMKHRFRLADAGCWSWQLDGEADARCRVIAFLLLLLLFYAACAPLYNIRHDLQTLNCKMPPCRACIDDE
jgi:hypothetical protein